MRYFIVLFRNGEVGGAVGRHEQAKPALTGVRLGDTDVVVAVLTAIDLRTEWLFTATPRASNGLNSRHLVTP